MYTYSTLNSFSVPKSTRYGAESLLAKITTTGRVVCIAAKHAVSFFKRSMSLSDIFFICTFSLPFKFHRAAKRTALLLTTITTSSWVKFLPALIAPSFLKSKMLSLSMTMVFMPMIVKRHNFEVFNSVIRSITIFMVNCFLSFERSIKMFRHYITMLKHVFFAVAMWGIIGVDLHISVFKKRLSSSPIMMIFPKTSKDFYSIGASYVFFHKPIVAFLIPGVKA